MDKNTGMGNGQSGKRTRGEELLSIHCATCGAPTEYSIERHSYACAYCGNTTAIRQGLREKRGFRALRQRALREERRGFEALAGNCSGCGSTIVFPPDEVLQDCPFCGRALVRGDYLQSAEFPELVIPFRLTPGEARGQLEAWCAKNRGKREARHLAATLDAMQGYYLPYELVRGPIDCGVSREGSARTFECGGFLDGIFVNTSTQLDNLTLNGMEPFDLRELAEFDLGYLAKQKAKVDVVDQSTLDKRVRQEVSASYGPVVERTLETRNVSIEPHTDDLLRMPVLLPVYYVSEGGVCAAVNGQTGKVAVRSERVRKTLPWWIRPIVLTLAVFALAFATALWLTQTWEVALWVSGAFTLVMGLIFYTAYSNAYEGEERRTLDPQILTSGGTLVRMPDGSLRASGGTAIVEPMTPLFFEDVDGQRTQVQIRFTTTIRMVKMLALGLVIMFLPIVLAFVLNGLSARGLHPDGAAVWLCIFVPVVPAYWIKIGRIDIYENPYVFVTDERGRRRKLKTQSRTTTVREVVRMLFSPGLIVAGLALLLFLFMDVYLVLGG